MEKFRSTSVPHFLFFRDGHLKDTVVGPNVPQIERALREHVPKATDPVVEPTVRRHTSLFVRSLSFSPLTYPAHLLRFLFS